MSRLRTHLSDEAIAALRERVTRLSGQQAQAQADADDLLALYSELTEVMRTPEPTIRTHAALERSLVHEDYLRACGKVTKLRNEFDAARERLTIWLQLRKVVVK